MASDEKHHRLSFLHRRHKHSSDASSLASSSKGDLPQYASGIQLETMSTHKSSLEDNADAESVNTSLPAYDTLYGSLSNTAADTNASSLASFHPTLQLQLDTTGKSSCSAIAATLRPDPICAYLVSGSDDTALYHEEPALVSLRTKRSSNSCTLVTGQSYGRLTGRRNYGSDQITVGSTVYRIGPGRPPRVGLFAVDQQIHEQLPALTVASEKEPNGTVPWDKYEIHNKSIFNRVQTFRTRLGTYEWRYATRAERKALSKQLIETASRSGTGAMPTLKEVTKYHSVNNLMVLERVTQVYGSVDNGEGASSVGKPQEVRRPVARLIRSKAMRTPGSSSHSAGNGGRLQMDLSEWMPSAAAAAAATNTGDSKAAQPSADEQTDRDMAIALIVSSCITMLKREVDRRRGQEAAVVASA
ncbi:hypothetical protein SEUCBS139899_001647 [Sporothrix eucalyptigena]|uniref:Uncharacterized protein n=1 Tax=Sporothrix eucalyptigena TaxID=1812306 RepID=A0ABP0CLB7_9PEZI